MNQTKSGISVLVVNNDLVVYSEWINTDKYVISPIQADVNKQNLDKVDYIYLDNILYYFADNMNIKEEEFCFLQTAEAIFADKISLLETIENNNYSYHTILQIDLKENVSVK